MKNRYLEAESDVETIGVLEEIEYDIVKSPQFMRMLSGLYTYPIKAIVREYWTNGEDGHVALRRTGVEPSRPIEIHVPNTIEPWYGVRDYGIGMDHDTAMYVYTKYGESSKTGNNEETGTFGLGAKAAHAYHRGADQWTATCYLDGVKRLYVASRNKRGIPTFVLFETTKTDEPNGVEIRIPVPSNDIYEFRGEISQMARHAQEPFKIIGDTSGVSSGMYEPETYKFRCDAYGENPVNTRTPAVRMGSVVYPLDLDKLPKGHKFALENKVLFLEMGDVDIVPAREHLEYTEETIATLDQKVREVMKAELEPFKTLDPVDDFYAHYQQCRRIMGRDAMYVTRMHTFLDLLEDDTKDKFEEFWDSMLPKDGRSYYYYPIRLEALAKTDEEKEFLDQWEVRTYRWYDSYNKSLTQESVEPAIKGDLHDTRRGDVSALFIADSRKGVTAVKRALRNENHNKVSNKFQIFTWKEKGALPEEKDVKKLQELLRGIPSETSSELCVKYPDLLNTSRSSSGGGSSTSAPASLWKLDINSGRWYEATVDLEDGGYWVEMAYRKYSEDNQWYFLNIPYSHILYLLQTFGSYDGSPIYGIPKSRISKVKNNEDWENFEETFDSELQKILREHVMELGETKAQSALLNADFESIFRLQLSQDFDTGPLREFYDACEDMQRVAKDNQRLQQALHSIQYWRRRHNTEDNPLDLEITTKLSEEAVKVTELEEALLEKYPLLTAILERFSSWSSDVRKVVVGYVELCDDNAIMKAKLAQLEKEDVSDADQ